MLLVEPLAPALMAYYTRYAPTAFGPRSRVTPGIKWLLILNSVIFIVYFLAVQLQIIPLLWLFRALSLTPDWVLRGAILWQPVTYLFLHSPHGFGHILFNMLMLWMFGIYLERDWGTRRFVNFYIFCGVGAGLCDVAARFLWAHPIELHISTIGASGAIYGVLLAYGLLYPDRTILFWFLFPIPARIFVLILGGIAFLSTFGTSNSGISHVAHLGGMVFGYFHLRYQTRFPDIDWMGGYRNWRRKRARHKFEVYMRKRDQSEPWVN